MNENDTVDLWYALQEKKLRAMNKKISEERMKPRYRCCGRLEEEGHNEHCVNYQPEGETKINRFVEHYPAYCDYDPKSYGFDTLEELLNIEFVKRFKNQKGFCRYSYSSPHLMAEYNEGKKWWCVGSIRNNLGLPKWEPIYEKDSK